MHKWLSAVLVMALLAGCAEDSKDTADDAETTLGQAADAVPLFLATADANLTLEGLVIAEGEAINFTLSSQANITAVAWAVESVAEAAASATADGNSTAQGNATAGGNATTEGNATVEPVLLASGTGLPANVSVMPPAGNQTLVIRASADGYSDHVMQYAIRVVAAVGDVVDDVVEEADPCAGAVAQEALVLEGSDLVGVYPATSTISIPFTVEPCQKSLHAEIAISGGGVDVDWAVFDATGASRDSKASGATLAEDPLNVKGDMPAGEWRFDVELWAGAAADYEITVTFTA